ncbi:ATP-binding protein [Crossiella cryophila]|uniref:Tetratricopeptide (TPR) repeat protein n=1 Tax=Crossiella cryophila TaxID=43355 RepID=A0A7W7FVY6_9PSEU|nr:tetratricopeptide repeat protein [Crossiella cryophila]MBB4679028.1 tetratricopeptide (TPR) repeat protein [Crossiella cryophila]
MTHSNDNAGSVGGHLIQAASITGDIHLGATPPPIPRQLPPAPTSFVGRTPELTALTNALGGNATVAITALAGTGGIGKTALALHWAHQRLEDFPDGQLFVDLRGFSPDSEPLAPETAVHGFLDALGQDPAHQPADPFAHYRSLVAGKRLLIILDNAVDTAQVVPLLPGSPTCTVLVTSRNHLPGLIGAHGAQHVALDVLPRQAAHELLATRLGHADPADLRELGELCGGLPLALTIVAGRARIQPHLPLSEVIAELRDTGLDEDDPTASVTAVLSWSHRALSVEQARVFGLLGIAPGPDISLPAATALAGSPDTRRTLRALEQASLIHRDTANRWRMHDLVRKFAATVAIDRDLTGLTDFYLHTALAAHHHLDQLHVHPLPPGPPRTPPLELPDEQAALTWFDAEHPGLLTALHLGDPLLTWQLAWALTTFQQRRGHQHDHHTTWALGLAAADQLDHAEARHTALRLLGRACLRLGQPREALDHLRRAVELATEANDLAGQAHAQRALALAWQALGDHQRALEAATHALDAFEQLNAPEWRAKALKGYGWHLVNLGLELKAVDYFTTALALSRTHDYRDGEAGALHSLGSIALKLGRHHEAIDYLHQALAQYRELGDTYEQADILRRLGSAHTALGQTGQAATAWRESLVLHQAQHRHQQVNWLLARLGEG